MNRTGKTADHRLILASASARRRTLLASVGLAFDVVPASVDEAVREGETGSDAAVRLALAKAADVAERHPEHLVLGADTLVEIEGRLVGKPSGAGDAREILHALSGRWHNVVTGVALVVPDRAPASGHSTTRVRFAHLDADEIERYVRSGEPFDKAGAYAIQGAGGWFVEEIRGSASNVIGLPLELVRRMLGRAGVRPPLAPSGAP